MTYFRFLAGILFCLISVQLCQCNSEFPRAKISNGDLKGIFLKSRDGNTYSAFKGIPYANKPKRFQLAEPADSWDGIRDATKFGESCLHKELFSPDIKGGEDCLFVNVFVSKKVSQKLPVMVFIHGGGFMAGTSSELGPDYFMDEEVILVTLNYRLGALGFLSTGDTAVEANLGLKDQLLAIKWVQKNIEAFGGDPEKVTIFGESAGSASVHYHVLSPLSKGLFSQAILQSGSALNSWAFSKSTSENAFALGNKLGCNTESSKKLMECLHGESLDDIVKQDFSEWFVDPIVYFHPTIDVEGSEQMFIPKSPIKMLKEGNFNKIPLIFTACEDEGILFHSAAVVGSEKLTKEMNEDYPRVFPITFLYDKDFSISQRNWISSHIKKFYFGKKQIGKETFQNLTNLYSDRHFLHGIQTALPFHAKYNEVYNAILAYRGSISYSIVLGIQEVLGVAHGDDLLYLFNVDGLPKVAPNSKDEEASKIMVKLWTNFASTGKPQHQLLKVSWEPLDASKLTAQGIPWMQLKNPPEVLQDPYKERLQFWDKVFDKAENLRKKEL